MWSRTLRECFGLCATVVFAASCRQQMADQPRYDPYEESTFFPDDLSARPLPVGVVSRRSEIRRVNDSQDLPFELTTQVVRRGRERFDIFCAPCHGLTGKGDGMVTLRGLRRPPPTLHAERLRSAAPGYFYKVIENGFGSMPSYAYQVPHEDRWAIAAYIQALQLSQWATTQDVPAAELERLERERR
jgi:hypothetical protein